MKRLALLIFILVVQTLPSYGQRPPLVVKTWAYQLQKIDIGAIVANPSFELLVMDFSPDGSRDNRFSLSDISKIKQSGKKALAYISIGEAENYRSYWQSNWSTTPPAWLGPENPQWPGNFKVRFWDPNWQQIVFDYIKDIYDQGFDGIYCDIIDAYYFWRTEQPEKPTADSLMMQFLVNIRSYVTSLGNRPFYIVPQNGESILHEPNITPNLRDSFFSAVDGIGVEDVFFRGNSSVNNPYNPEVNRFPNLQEFIDHNKVVLSIEYLTEPQLIDQYISHARAMHYIPYCTVRLLDTLTNGISSQAAVQSASASDGLSVLYAVDGSAYLSFQSQVAEHMSIRLTDLLGRQSFLIFESEVRPGRTYRIDFSHRSVQPGVYFAALHSISNNAFAKVLVR